MGILRIQSRKYKLEALVYRQYWLWLHEAMSAQHDNKITWIPDEGESLSEARKAFLFVANREGIDVKVRRVQGENSLALTFPRPKKVVPLSTEECKRMVLDALVRADKPLSRLTILEETGISGKIWQKLIKQMLDENLVLRIGERIKTAYIPASRPAGQDEISGPGAP